MSIRIKAVAIAIASGLLAGFGGVALHNAYAPWGAFVGLYICYSTLSLLGKRYQSRLIKGIAALASLWVLIKASTHGVSYEILVYGNRMGTFYTLANVTLLSYCIFRREWKSSVTSKL